MGFGGWSGDGPGRTTVEGVFSVDSRRLCPEPFNGLTKLLWIMGDGLNSNSSIPSRLGLEGVGIAREAGPRVVTSRFEVDLPIAGAFSEGRGSSSHGKVVCPPCSPFRAGDLNFTEDLRGGGVGAGGVRVFLGLSGSI